MGKSTKEGCEDMGVIKHREKALESIICIGVQESLDLDNYREQATQTERVAEGLLTSFMALTTFIS